MVVKKMDGSDRLIVGPGGDLIDFGRCRARLLVRVINSPSPRIVVDLRFTTSSDHTIAEFDPY